MRYTVASLLFVSLLGAYWTAYSLYSKVADHDQPHLLDLATPSGVGLGLRSLPAEQREQACTVRGDEAVRFAVCFYGMIRRIDNTIHGIQAHLLNPLRARGAVDVFVHTLLVEKLSSGNQYHSYAAERGVDLQPADFLRLTPCRFAAEDQDLLDARRMAMPCAEITGSAAGRQQRRRARQQQQQQQQQGSASSSGSSGGGSSGSSSGSPGCDRGHHHGWRYGAKGTPPTPFTNPLPEAESLASSARRTALQIRLGTRYRNAVRLGVAHVGAKHYTESMMLNVYRAYYSLAQVAQLLQAHERAAAFRYTDIVIARPDIAYLTPLRWTHRPDDVITVPNFAHNFGVNDRFAYGRRAAMLRYMDRLDWLRRTWHNDLNSTEALVCEHLLRQATSIRISVTPLCIVRTRATGILVQEVLNVSKSRLGLPRLCVGRPGNPPLRLLATRHDEEWPCGEPGAFIAAPTSATLGTSASRSCRKGGAAAEPLRCMQVVSSAEPLNASDPTNLTGSVLTMTSLVAGRQAMRKLLL